MCVKYVLLSRLLSTVLISFNEVKEVFKAKKEAAKY
jgi:hypothetical protein